MNTQIKHLIRRVLSLAAFATLIAAVSIAFADASTTKDNLSYAPGQPLSRNHLQELTLSKALPYKSSIPSSAANKSDAHSVLSGTLNLNIATETELIKLPGIGPKKAERIVSWRKQHGKFRRVVDLRRVKGFGAKSVKKLMPYLSVKGTSTLQ